ncbi:5-formyltetrahydrofolate cyclo-ligase [Ningiella sp. W23]|uniref:5-formyltetrahydrofolate cyclo-ligase n=1 Tax=Ningiella sp. W23 TaxID=3023715 RepID=UPI003757FB68
METESRDELPVTANASIMQIRNTLRQTFRERRRSLNSSEKQSAAQALLERCKALELFDDCERIALYMTSDSELDTRPLIEYLWSQGKVVYLPVLHPFCSGHLIFLAYDKNTIMKANGYGISEPVLNCSELCPTNKLDILFTPLVAFDESGNRLGMGGGFYDRTLAGLKRAGLNKTSEKAPKIIGLAYDIQKTLALPAQAWDEPLGNILTPTTFFQFGS